MTRSPRCSLLSLGWLACTAPAHAAGGHFDVDDAAIVEPGHCQYETWLSRAPGASSTLFHVGPGCRVGPLELGVNLDRSSTSNDRRSTVGPQLKWLVDPLVDPVVGALGVGLAWSAAYDLTHGGRPAHTLYVPLTWAPVDTLALNANFGADRDLRGARTRRIGVSAEWAAHERLTVIGERVKFAGDWTSRLGLRLLLGDAISVDLSAARSGPRATPVYVIGLNHDFAR